MIVVNPLRDVSVLAATLGFATVMTSAQAPSPQTARPIRPLTTATFKRTPARVARGRYLTEGVLQCFRCHSERDWSKPGAPPRAGRKGAGYVWAAEGRPWLVAPNITPDLETGAGRWTDDMLVRATTEGVSHTGRPLSTQMWFRSFRFLSDEDLASVVVYLRTIPAVRNPLPETQLPEGMADQLMRVLPRARSSVAASASSDPIERGKYLARVADCSGCHTAHEAPANPGIYGGGHLIQLGERSAFSSNLTADSSGIPYYDAPLFIETIRTGRVRARTLEPAMPWIVFRHMTDGDLRGLFAFLRSVTPVHHNVSNVDAPALCAACRQNHGLGEHNVAIVLAPIAVDPALYDELAGEYEIEDGRRAMMAKEDGSLVIHLPRRTVKLMPIGTLDFASTEVPWRIHFERDASGRVTGFSFLGFGDLDARRVR